MAASKKLKATSLNKTQNESRSYETIITDLKHNLEVLNIDLNNQDSTIDDLKNKKQTLIDTSSNIKTQIEEIEQDQVKFTNIDADAINQINTIKSEYISAHGGDIIDREIQLKTNKLMS